MRVTLWGYFPGSLKGFFEGSFQDSGFWFRDFGLHLRGLA